MAERWGEARRMPAAFLQWWVGELAGLLPRAARRTSGSSRSHLLLIRNGEDTVLIEQAGRRGAKKLGSSSGDPRLALTYLNDRRYRKWPIVVRLGGHLGLRKVVDLPLVASEELGQLLYFELDRLTPFKAEDVGFNWRVLEADRKKNRLQVALEMAPKAVLDDVLNLVAEHGREVDRIELEGDNGSKDSNGSLPLDLMPRAVQEPEQSSRRWTRHALPLLVCGLAVVAVALPLQKQQTLIDQQDQQIKPLRAEAEKSLALREALEASATTKRFLIAAKNDRVTMTEVLAELTRLIPDHSHIIQLQIHDSKIEINGLTGQASDLIAIFDQSPMLSSPQFRSPVTRDPRSGKDRFQISVDLAGPSS
ncbi:MAG: PilN domain-containing protein [Geminicoccales bacterium]